LLLKVIKNIAPQICDICDVSFHQYTLRIVDADRNGLMQHLLDKGIPCAIYYPPLHAQKHIWMKGIRKIFQLQIS
jgi:dTDP-4-amino-4,6-dideoxygalactose transaminase